MKPKTRSNDILIENAGAELVIYDRTTSKAHNLNESASVLWNLCDGARSIPEIVDAMQSRLGPAYDEAAVLKGITDFEAAGLLEPESVDKTEQMGRRELGRRVAAMAAGAVVLPAITSVAANAAPKAKSKK